MIKNIMITDECDFSSWRRFYKIFLYVSKSDFRPVTQNDLMNILKDSKTGLAFTRDLRLLIDKGICKVDKTKRKFEYTFDKNKLILFLRDTYQFKLIGQFIEFTVQFHHY